MNLLQVSQRTQVSCRSHFEKSCQVSSWHLLTWGNAAKKKRPDLQLIEDGGFFFYNNTSTILLVTSWTYIGGLFSAAARWVDLLHLPAAILKLYIEALNRFSHVFGRVGKRASNRDCPGPALRSTDNQAPLMTSSNKIKCSAGKQVRVSEIRFEVVALLAPISICIFFFF